MTTQPAAIEAPSNTPDKVTTLIADATAVGLTVTREETRGEMHSWTISSPNPIDNTQVWLFWTPGQRDGRLALTVYYGPHTGQRRTVTRRSVRYTLTDMAESLQRHLDREAAKAAAAPKVTIAQPDPARPGWFMVGQVIMDRWAGTSHTVLDVEHRNGRTSSVLVSRDGGYGKPVWYGDAPDAIAPLSALEGPHIGRPENTMRAWPKSIYSAIEATKLTLHDQCLSGYVLAAPNQRGVVVNLPRDTDPERHLILLQRYMPYPCHVGIHQVSPPSEGRYCTLLITPKE